MRPILYIPVTVVEALKEYQAKTTVRIGDLEMNLQILPNLTLVRYLLSTTDPGHNRTTDSGFFGRSSVVPMIPSSNRTTMTIQTLNSSFILNDHLLLLAEHIISPTRV